MLSNLIILWGSYIYFKKTSLCYNWGIKHDDKLPIILNTCSASAAFVNNIFHYTYQLKSKKAYRVVLRGLHVTEDINQIKTELKKYYHKVRQIVNVQHRTTKEAVPVY